jgi:hypothetical protein
MPRSAAFHSSIRNAMTSSCPVAKTAAAVMGIGNALTIQHFELEVQHGYSVVIAFCLGI